MNNLHKCILVLSMCSSVALAGQNSKSTNTNTYNSPLSYVRKPVTVYLPYKTCTRLEDQENKHTVRHITYDGYDYWAIDSDFEKQSYSCYRDIDFRTIYSPFYSVTRRAGGDSKIEGHFGVFVYLERPGPLRIKNPLDDAAFWSNENTTYFASEYGLRDGESVHNPMYYSDKIKHFSFYFYDKEEDTREIHVYIQYS